MRTYVVDFDDEVGFWELAEARDKGLLLYNGVVQETDFSVDYAVFLRDALQDLKGYNCRVILGEHDVGDILALLCLLF